MAAEPPPLLDIVGLTKRFTGTLALDGVDFAVRRGEIHALLGENGAGKSTLIKILAGVHGADAGAIRLGGRAVDPARERLPIAFIHQDLGLVETMTVAENVALTTGYPRARIGTIDWAGARQRAADALRVLGSGVDADARVGTLPAAERSIVAIGRALAVRADVLVLDEPTAALPEADVARLLDALRRLRNSSMGIVYVTHRLDEVFRIADRVTVLRDGRRIATMPVAETSPADLVFKIIGRLPSEVFVKPPAPAPEAVLLVEDLAVGHVGPISFDIAAGEILALVGLRGAGQGAIGRGLFGERAIDGGRVRLAGEPIEPADCAGAIRRRIGFVSSRRREESLAPGLTVRENLFVNPRTTGKGVLSLIRRDTEAGSAQRILDRFSVRPRDTERPIATLSGGNQQKVVLARWMEAGTRLLILEEPTFGVDVGSKAEIYRQLQAALDQGSAVLLISSDFEEVAGIAHRAIVLDRGRAVAELPRADLSVERLTALASGAAPVRETVP